MVAQIEESLELTYLTALVESTRSVFGTMLQTPVRIGNPNLQMAMDLRFDATGVISLMGDAVGIVILSLPFESATKIVEKFTYEKMGIESDDFPDAVGELANMIAGGAKGKLEKHNVAISTPSVIIGKQHRVMLQRGIRLIGLPCITDIGEFTVYVSIKCVAEAAAVPVKAALPM